MSTLHAALTVAEKMTQCAEQAAQRGYRVLGFYLGRAELEDVAEWCGELTTADALTSRRHFEYAGFPVEAVAEASHFSMDVVEA